VPALEPGPVHVDGTARHPAPVVDLGDLQLPRLAYLGQADADVFVRILQEAGSPENSDYLVLL